MGFQHNPLLKAGSAPGSDQAAQGSVNLRPENLRGHTTAHGAHAGFSLDEAKPDVLIFSNNLCYSEKVLIKPLKLFQEEQHSRDKTKR